MPRNSMRTQPDSSDQPMRPVLTPEARENQLINLAYNAAEKQLREGTASSQVITHFLKLGTVREQLELERIRHANALDEAKIEALQSNKHLEELYNNALEAMRSYGGYNNEKSDENENIH